jgi:nucleotide-binding universal stress UspA family protein
MQKQVHRVARKARKFAEDASLSIEAELSIGDEVESIIEAAKHNQSDLLVIGMPKHNWIIGRSAQEVAERVPCALLGIR